MKSSKTRNAVEWLENHPDKSVSEASRKFNVRATAIYSARKKLRPSLPVVIDVDHIAKSSESLIVIVKTNHPAQLLKELFQ